MDKLYTQTHEWAQLDGDIATIGLSKFALTELGEAVFLQLPKVGDSVEAGEEVVIVESTKAATDIPSALSGVVTEVNASLVEDQGPLNTDPEGEGWLFKLQVSNAQELRVLLSGDAYQAMLSS